MHRASVHASGVKDIVLILPVLQSWYGSFVAGEAVWSQRNGVVGRRRTRAPVVADLVDPILSFLYFRPEVMQLATFAQGLNLNPKGIFAQIQVGVLFGMG